MRSCARSIDPPTDEPASRSIGWARWRSGSPSTRRVRSAASERARVSKERIEGAIHGDGLETVFQPIVISHHGRIRGVEALTRFMSKPRRSPETWFVEAAGQGLLTQLELAAAHRALEHLDRVPEDVYLSVNVSPETLRDLASSRCCRRFRRRGWCWSSRSGRPSWTTTEMSAWLDELRALGAGSRSMTSGRDSPGSDTSSSSRPTS